MSLDFSVYAPIITDVASANYTHNVTRMWKEAGVYDALYMSDGKQVKDIIDELNSGLSNMYANPEKYIAMNPTNGWGSYESALDWLKQLISNIESYPDGTICISK